MIHSNATPHIEGNRGLELQRDTYVLGSVGIDVQFCAPRKGATGDGVIVVIVFGGGCTCFCRGGRLADSDAVGGLGADGAPLLRMIGQIYATWDLIRLYR